MFRRARIYSFPADLSVRCTQLRLISKLFLPKTIMMKKYVVSIFSHVIENGSFLFRFLSLHQTRKKQFSVSLYRMISNLCRATGDATAKTAKVKHKTLHAHRTSVVRFHSMTFHIVLPQSQSSMHKHFPVEKNISYKMSIHAASAPAHSLMWNNIDSFIVSVCIVRYCVFYLSRN